MSKLYNPSHRIKFTNISENYQVRPQYKAELSKIYSSIITYVIGHYDGTLKYKQQVVKVLNIITFAKYTDELLPSDWIIGRPFENIPEYSDSEIEESLSDIYLTVDAIDWDISPVDTPVNDMPDYSIPISAVSSSNLVQKSVPSESLPNYNPSEVITPTPSTDLYIQSPEVPQFNINKPWIQKRCGSDLLTIYTTIPEIPKRQRDISITTDVNFMTEKDLLNLYPNQFINTRAAILYEREQQKDLTFDPIYGLITPIDGYDYDTILKNIIEYPHFYHAVRLQNDKLESFYSYMEIDGELVDTLAIWDSLSISKKIPKHTEFIKDYLMRKYLLDRDIKHKEFKYPLYGTLDPFITLFMPASEYRNLGYDPIDLARQCVLSRVSYKQSRNPVLKRIHENE